MLFMASVTGVILARELGPEARGVLAAVLIIPGILVLAGGFGLTQSATVWASNRDTPAGTLAGTLLALALAQSAVLIPLGVVATLVLMRRYPLSVQHLMLAYLIPYIPATLIATYWMGILRGKHLFHHYNFARMAVIAIPAVILPILVLAGALTIANCIIVYIGSFLFTMLLVLYWTKAHLDTPICCSRNLGGELLHFGMRSYLGNVSEMMNQRLDQLVMAIFLNPAQLGLYVIAVTASSPVSMIGSSIAIPATPAVARNNSAVDSQTTNARYLGIAFVLSSLFVIPLLFLMPRLIALVFGQDYLHASTAARILVAAGFMLSVNAVLSALLTGLRQPLASSIAQVIALIATGVGLILLLPILGIAGAALTSLIAYFISSAYMFRRLAALLELSSFALLQGTLSSILDSAHLAAGKLHRLHSQFFNPRV